MPYILFKINSEKTTDNLSIHDSCVKDIENFTRDKNLKIDHLNDLHPIISIEKLNNNIKQILTFMNLGKKTYLDYFHDNEKEQEMLWILRSMLLYNILAIATLYLQNPKLIVKNQYKIEPGLDTLFKIGNFGSYNKTSDIDLGIQFIGNYKTTPIPHMYKIIWLIESLFIDLTSHDTLQFDIELYGDMLTINKNKVETFYLDTSDLNEEETKLLYPTALYSVARNQLMDVKDKKNIELDLDMSVIENRINKEFINKSLKEKLDKKERTIFHYLKHPKKLWDDNDLYEPYKIVKKEMQHYLEKSLKNGKYVQTDYARKLYYDALKEAEILRIEYLNSGTHDKNKRINLMLSIAKALSYRMEDYTSVSTVTHVVRIIQTNKDVTSGNKKRKNPFIKCENKVEHYKNPFCMVGKCGFILSIIEQIGFMKRFYNAYCKDNNSKCLSKLVKYEFRVAHAIKELNLYMAIKKKTRKTNTRKIRTRKTRQK